MLIWLPCVGFAFLKLHTKSIRQAFCSGRGEADINGRPAWYFMDGCRIGLLTKDEIPLSESNEMTSAEAS